MSSVVLDTSALLAVIKRERGGELVADAISEALISSVNLAEATSVLIRAGMAPETAREILEIQEFDVADFDRALAEDTGALIARTRRNGLSLGDCACLALAAREKLPALTVDHAWRGLDIGIEIQLIR